MKTFESMDSWIALRQELLRHGQTIGFVPTMGALHEGHISLIRKAKEENDFVVVSIFVNPAQFNNKEDLDKYPRSLASDLDQLLAAEADAVLLPSESEIYKDDYQFKMCEEKFSKILCGAHGPGHFNGVLTVVMKLLGLTQASRCYMGEKDYQQYFLVNEMVNALFVCTEIIPCPTQREKSGLAMSSRNQRLSPEGKTRAPLIYKFLTNSSTSEETRKQLTDAGFIVDYVEEHWGRRFAAATIENVRLIDNVKI